jgi:hypothetical protein
MGTVIMINRLPDSGADGHDGHGHHREANDHSDESSHRWVHGIRRRQKYHCQEVQSQNLQHVVLQKFVAYGKATLGSRVYLRIRRNFSFGGIRESNVPSASLWASIGKK